MLKETFKFWASRCHVKGPLPPLSMHKILLQSAACARSELGGWGPDIAGPICPT